MKAVSKNNIRSITTTTIIKNDDDMAWEQLPESKRTIAYERLRIVKAVEEHAKDDISLNSAIDTLLGEIVSGEADQGLIDTARHLGRKNNPPNRATIYRWFNGYTKNGIIALAPAHKGRVRKEYGWEPRALHFWSKPSKPSMQAVSDWLIEEGHTSATPPRVTRFIKSLPSTLGEKGKGRVGPNLYKNTMKKYVRRTTENIGVGDCYQGDGHTLDIYLEHPTGRKPWRAELTLWIDVKSRYVVGWYLSEAESAHSTLFALSHGLMTHDHIPAMLHIDNGSGYKNKMMESEAIGFYDRFGIDIMHSLPYNAKGKGHVERFFGTMERSFNKRFDSYCGADMDNEAIQKLLKRYKKGEAKLLTMAQWLIAFDAWLEQYHNKPHRGLDGKTPAEVWAVLDNNPVVPRTAAIWWPRQRRTVQREAITIDKREYLHAELINYNGKKVIVEYSIHNDSYVRILNLKGQWICDATLVKKADYVPTSRITEAKQKRLHAQVKRLEVHADEKRERAGMAITHADVLLEMEGGAEQAIEEKNPGADTIPPSTVPTPGAEDDDGLKIDLTETDY